MYAVAKEQVHTHSHVHTKQKHQRAATIRKHVMYRLWTYTSTPLLEVNNEAFITFKSDLRFPPTLYFYPLCKSNGRQCKLLLASINLVFVIATMFSIFYQSYSWILKSIIFRKVCERLVMAFPYYAQFACIIEQITRHLKCFFMFFPIAIAIDLWRFIFMHPEFCRLSRAKETLSDKSVLM